MDVFFLTDTMPKKDLMNLSWDSFPTHLKTMLVGMMTSSDYTDVTLVCGDQVQFKAHKEYSLDVHCAHIFIVPNFSGR